MNHDKKSKSSSNQLSLFDIFSDNQNQTKNETNTPSNNTGNFRNQSDKPGTGDFTNGGNNSDNLQSPFDITASASGQHEIGGNPGELPQSSYGSLPQQNGSEIPESDSGGKNDITQSDTNGSASGNTIQRSNRLKNYSYSYNPAQNDTVSSPKVRPLKS